MSRREDAELLCQRLKAKIRKWRDALITLCCCQGVRGTGARTGKGASDVANKDQCCQPQVCWLVIWILSAMYHKKWAGQPIRIQSSVHHGHVDTTTGSSTVVDDAIKEGRRKQSRRCCLNRSECLRLHQHLHPPVVTTTTLTAMATSHTSPSVQHAAVSKPVLSSQKPTVKLPKLSLLTFSGEYLYFL